MTTIADVLRLVRGALDEPTASTWQDLDLIDWINDGIQEVQAQLKAVNEDWLLTRMKTSDSALTINGSSFSPSSLTMTTGTDTYTLPEDCVGIKSIEPLSQSDKDAGIRFIPNDMNGVRGAEVYRSAPSDVVTYYYDVYGSNSLRVQPLPTSTFGIELWYNKVASPYTLNQTISTLPYWAISSLVQYAVYRAQDAINDASAPGKKQLADIAINRLTEFASPRQSQDPVIVEGIWDEEDFSSDYSLR